MICMMKMLVNADHEYIRSMMSVIIMRYGFEIANLQTYGNYIGIQIQALGTVTLGKEIPRKYSIRPGALNWLSILLKQVKQGHQEMAFIEKCSIPQAL